MMEVTERNIDSRYEKRSFSRVHYEDMWSPYAQCQEIVKREWMDHSGWEGENVVPLFQKKIRDTMAELKLWSKEEFGGRTKQLDKLLTDLETSRQQHLQYVDEESIKKLERQIDNLLVDEEIY